MKLQHVVAALALSGIASLTGAASAQAKPNAKLLSVVEACKPEAKTLLEQVVAIDSGTGDADGLNRVGALYESKLTALGASIRHVTPTSPPLGDNIVATVMGSGKGRILLIAHMDTVFGRGDAAARKPHWEGDHYIGPGAGDDKSGGVIAICVLGALKAIGYRDFARIDLLLNASEETGSLSSRDLIQSLARESDLAINLERGVPVDRTVYSRKGSAQLVLEMTGRAAHSGLEPEKGRNAALEAAHAALELGKLADPAKETTVTVTVLNGGDKNNVVPDKAVVKADVRAFTAEEFGRVEKAAAALAMKPSIDGVTIKSQLNRTFPPWPRAASTDAMITRANKLYAELGRSLTPQAVGSSADVAYAALTGTPSMDSMGLEGGGAHGLDDYVDIGSLTPRAYLLARLLMDVGHAPPAR